MAATVEKEVDGTLSGFDQITGTMPVRYMYKDLAVGEDILKHADIPPIDHVVMFNDTPLYATKYDVTKYFEATSDTPANGEVVVLYSTASTGGSFKTADYIAWERSYQKESVRMPTFALQARYYQKAGETAESTRWDWVEQGLAIPVKYTALNVTVNFIAGNLQTRNQILPIMAAIDAQEDHLHIISQFGTRKWVMQPAQVRQADALRVEISYHWISDPGNSVPSISAKELQADPTIGYYVILPEEERLPFHTWQVRPQTVIITDPKTRTSAYQDPQIYTVDLYPPKLPSGADNPRYTPLGDQTLPGNPFP